MHLYDSTTVVVNGLGLSDLREYAALLVSEDNAPIGPSLAIALKSIRQDFEIVEIYVRPIGDGAFEPLSNRHFIYSGAWVVVARRRHSQRDPRIVGIMLAKDEADVIGEVVESYAGRLHRLYVHAGDDATRAAIPQADWIRTMPLGPAIADGYRQVLLEQARQDAAVEEDLRPMWVLTVQGDEIYDDDLLHHVRLADQERATVMTAQVATFLLHESQREGWDWSRPLQKRLTHYIWDFGEFMGFLDFPWIHYWPEEHMRAHPHGIYPAKWASARPVRRHYPFRTPDQAQARIQDRIASGWQPHYEHYQAIFLKDTAAGRPIKRYFGWFPEAERTEGIW